MRHLSITGYYAGTRLCGAPNNGTNKAWHASYVTQKLMDSGVICPECKAEYEAALSEDAEQPQ
jgi:hypothetical protein